MTGHLHKAGPLHSLRAVSAYNPVAPLFIPSAIIFGFSQKDKHKHILNHLRPGDHTTVVTVSTDTANKKETLSIVHNVSVPLQVKLSLTSVVASAITLEMP